MLIHVVRPGDNLWAIGKAYKVDYIKIIEANGLQNRDKLVVGEALIIPDKRKGNKNIEVNGFIIPTTSEKDKQIMSEVADYLTYVSPFSHHVNNDGSLTPLNDETVLTSAKVHKTAAMLSVTNISDSGFDTELIGKILNSNQLQQTLINNIIQLINREKLAGVIVDFERIPPEDREKYNDFLRKLVARAHAQKSLVATALAPKTSDLQQGPWYEAHDYRSQGKIVDFVILMTYEWGWSGGPPRAVAPIDEVRKVLDYAVRVIPPSKIMMGIPNYGYDWTLPYVPGGKFAEAIGNQEAMDRAVKVGALIKYDVKSQSPFYNYFDEKRKQHVVWFEDARSITSKFKLVSEYGLRGVSYWALGKAFPQNWYALNNMFKISKLIKK